MEESNRHDSNNHISSSETLSNPQNDRVMLSERSISIHSGPLPPASELSIYAALLPSAPDRILSMAEKQQNIHLEVIRNDYKYKSKGQLCAFGIVISSFALTACLAYVSEPLIGGIISFASIATVALAFIYGERTAKNKD